jgi:hypothetical protein
VIAGVPMYYGCDTGAAAGGIARETQPWTVQYQAKNASELVLTPITTAWVG